MCRIDSSSRPLPATTAFRISRALLVTLLLVHSGPAKGQPQEILELVKSGALDMGSDGIATPGDVILYTLRLENTSTDLSACADVFYLEVDDTLLGSLAADLSIIPGQVLTFSGSYAITQGDIDAGFVYNQATADGIPLSACVPQLDTSATAEHTLILLQIPSIALTKAGTLELGADGVANPGDRIDYTFTVGNNGNLQLTDITLTDPEITPITCPSGHPIPALAPGGEEICTASYPITQEDIDLGYKENSAEVTAESTAETPAAAVARKAVSGQAMVRVPIPQQPGILLSKTGTTDLGGDGVADPGDRIDYALQVSNPGNVTLTSVTLDDPLIPSLACPSGNPIPTLPPAASITCTASYPLTAADISSRSVVNTARAEGTAGTGTIEDENSETVTLPSPVPATGAIGLALLVLLLTGLGAVALRPASRSS